MEEFAIKFEAQLVSTSMTSAGGHKLTLRIAPEDILESPHNSEEKSIETQRVRSLMMQSSNTRFVCVLVQLEPESDQAVEPEDLRKRKKIMSILSMICRTEDENFAKFITTKSNVASSYREGEDALSILKDLYGFDSRTEIVENPELAKRIGSLIDEYRNE